MDLQRIGDFLASLRREQKLTQEKLGEKLGVSGKTISRWETGVYLPPVEMLQALSELYGVSINELLSGERLAASMQAEKAEENLVAVLQASPFELRERQAFWLRKWRKEHIGALMLLLILAAITQLLGIVRKNPWFNALGMLAVLAAQVRLRMRRDDYVEHHLYDEQLNQR